MNPEEIMAWVREQISGGADPAAVNQIIAEQTDFSTIQEVGAAVAQQFQQEADEFSRQAEAAHEIADHPVRSAAGSAIQEASFGFADEIAGAVTMNPQLGEDLEQAQQDREELAPGANLAAGFAGAVLPTAGAGIVAQGLGRAGMGIRGLNMFGGQPIRRGAAEGLFSAAARGGATGALAGGAAGAGFAEEGERLEGAQTGAKFGGAAGALFSAPFGLAAGLMGSNAGRGARVAQELVDHAEVPTVDRVVARGNIDDSKKMIQHTFYRPLEGIPGSPQLNQHVADLSKDPLVGNLIDPDLSARLRPLTQGQTLDADAGILFEEAQRLRTALRDTAFDFQNTSVGVRRRAREQAAKLDEAMQTAFPQGLETADAAWNRVSNRGRAIEQGIRMFDDREQEIRQVLSEMTPSERMAFNQGRLSEIVSELNVRNTQAVPLLKKMLDAGPETLTSLRHIFPEGPEGNAAFREFQTVLESNASQAKIADGLRRILQSSTVGIITGAVAGGVAGRMLGGRGGNN